MCQRKTGDFRLDSPTARLKEPHEERAEPATVAGSGRYRVDPESRDDIPAALNALPRKGWLSGPDKERESAEEFVKVRQQHPAVESALNHLKRRGLDRVRTHGKDGFQRTVALAVAAANLDRIGLILQRRERNRFRLAVCGGRRPGELRQRNVITQFLCP